MTFINNQMIPVLYSFRRCPYAMRARLAIASSNTRVELREVVLRDKPMAMIEASAKATVPVLILPDGTVVDESLDIMLWALDASDPCAWMAPDRQEMLDLIHTCDHEFKPHLDRYKYANRYEAVDPNEHRQHGEVFLRILDAKLEAKPYLMGEAISLADFAIFPFIRQFANVDPDWFKSTPYVKLQAWLQARLKSDSFIAIMTKYSQWHIDDNPTFFP